RLTAERIPPPAPQPTPLAVRPILAARAVAEYAGLLIAPLNLRMERDVATVPQATPEATLRNARLHEYQTLLGVLLVLGFVWWTRRGLRSHSIAGLCLAACLVAYLPISNLFSLNATVAEHWLYVPGAFLFLAVALSLRPPRPQPARALAAAILFVWLCALAARSWLRQADWHDQRTFFERTIAAGSDSARMHINLGNLESSAGHHDAALAHFRTAIAKAPEQPIAWLGLANAAIRARDFAAAHAALDKAQSSPLLAGDVLQARAVLEHLETGRDTADLLQKAVEAAPRNWAIRKRWLEHLDERGDTARAARELRDFLARESFRCESWLLLGNFLEKLAQPAAAVAAYEEAAALDARDPQSRARLAALRHP
ncbi:MAG TPA: tetratricopeptide repeat protein, partial [Chthoniobacteraceae bacterium]|nr:tetratricopeptide repeat protein [Chthoniobacteraceae bacterium]